MAAQLSMIHTIVFGKTKPIARNSKVGSGVACFWSGVELNLYILCSKSVTALSSTA